MKKILSNFWKEFKIFWFAIKTRTLSFKELNFFCFYGYIAYFNYFILNSPEIAYFIVVCLLLSSGKIHKYLGKDGFFFENLLLNIWYDPMYYQANSFWIKNFKENCKTRTFQELIREVPRLILMWFYTVLSSRGKPILYYFFCTWLVQFYLYIDYMAFLKLILYFIPLGLANLEAFKFHINKTYGFDSIKKLGWDNYEDLFNYQIKLLIKAGLSLVLTALVVLLTHELLSVIYNRWVYDVANLDVVMQFEDQIRQLKYAKEHNLTYIPSEIKRVTINTGRLVTPENLQEAFEIVYAKAIRLAQVVKNSFK